MSIQFTVPSEPAFPTLAAFLRTFDPAMTWSQARGHVYGRRVKVNGTLCLDDSRRLRTGDSVALLGNSAPPPPGLGSVKVVREDAAFLVIEKPSGMECERRHEQIRWSEQKRLSQPTVIESLEAMHHKVFGVHRLDRDTSGLMVYAKTPEARDALVASFARHDIERIYHAIAIGTVTPCTCRTYLVRDRGDSLRGSIAQPQPDAEEAITHIEVLEVLAGGLYTHVQCRLETGKTHQIRIHLAEMGHPVCGEKLYLRSAPNTPAIVDNSHAPRHALHCHILGFAHPGNGRKMRFESPWPEDLARWLPHIGKKA